MILLFDIKNFFFILNFLNRKNISKIDDKSNKSCSKNFPKKYFSNQLENQFRFFIYSNGSFTLKFGPRLL